MKRTIKIFLASSITDFKYERLELYAYIESIGRMFRKKYDIDVEPFICENDDPFLTADGRKQAVYNSELRDSDMVFFIFFNRIGQFTKEEFEVAKSKMQADGKPKIYTYFKTLGEGETMEDSLKKFMDMLDHTIGHYHCNFEHLDTVKLRMLMSLSLQELDFVEIGTDGGYCVVDGEKVMPLDNVAEFINNKNLAKLQAELATVEEEYYKMRPIYAKGGCDSEFYKKYSDIATRRRNLIDETEKLQKLIFNVSMRMVKDDIHGEITPRQKEAYRLFELGDYEGCMSVLDSKDIDEDFRQQRKRLKEENAAVCRKYIKEHRTAIEILETMADYKERFDEIERRYKKIIPVVFEEELELGAAYAYADYLNKHNDAEHAIRIAEKLRSVFERTTNFSNHDKAKLYNLLGIIYDARNDSKKAEDFYSRSIKIREDLAKSDPTRFNPDLADSYNNAGVFYAKQHDNTKAEDFYLKAIKIYKELAECNPARFNSGLAMVYNNAGVFYADQRDSKKAEDFNLRAIKIQEKLAEFDPTKFNSDLATSYNNAGTFYYKQGNSNNAEKFFLKAIEIREKLVESDPVRFYSDLALVYSNISVFYNNKDNKNQRNSTLSEQYCLRSIKIREELAKTDPLRFNQDLADSYNNAGTFYAYQHNSKKAEDFYLEAIKIYKNLAESDPARFNPYLAVSYFSYGMFKNDKTYLDKSLELAMTSPENPNCQQIIAFLTGNK